MTSPRPTSDARESGEQLETAARLAIEIAEHHLPRGTAGERRDLSRAIVNAIGICEKEVGTVVAGVVSAIHDGMRDDLVKTVRRLAIKQHVRLAEGGGTVPTGFSCAVCHGEWAEGAEEFHAKTCCAAVAKAGARTEAQKVPA